MEAVPGLSWAASPLVSPDTGRQSARHGASRHAPPTAGAVPSSPARPARPQRKNYIVLSTRGSVEDAWRVFTSAGLSDLSCGPGRGPEHNNLGWHSLYLGGKRRRGFRVSTGYDAVTPRYTLRYSAVPRNTGRRCRSLTYGWEGGVSWAATHATLVGI